MASATDGSVLTPRDITATGTWWPEEGWRSFLVHNYGGRRHKLKNNEAIRELLFEFLAQIQVLQEHDARVLHESDHEEFHVCLGVDNCGRRTNLAILGRKFHSSLRTPCIEAVILFDCRVVEAKKRNCSGLMVAEVRGANDFPVRIVNMH